MSTETPRNYALRKLAESGEPMSTSELRRPGSPDRNMAHILENLALDRLVKRTGTAKYGVAIWQITEQGRNALGATRKGDKA